MKLSHRIYRVSASFKILNILFHWPIVIKPDLDADHRSKVHRYMELLEKAGLHVAENPSFQDFFGLTENERCLIVAPLATDRIVEICRLDGYIDRATSSLKILEHNADSPAGTFFTPRINKVIINSGFMPRICAPSFSTAV